MTQRAAVSDAVGSRPENDGVRLFFKELNRSAGDDRSISVLVVTHVLPDRPFFLEALGSGYHLAKVYPKPKSITPSVLKTLKDVYEIEIVEREKLTAQKLLSDISDVVPDGNRVCLLDIGGYFAPALRELSDELGDRLIGVVEDTENGHQRYQRLLEDGPFPCPVLSVARSPLKNPEDHLVGEAVVYSLEALIRSVREVLQARQAVVLGYGKIGRSAANLLSRRNIRTAVVEPDPVRGAEALSHGFELIDRTPALKRSDLLVCASGNQSVSGADLRILKSGCFVASVTSSDDEFDLGDELETFQRNDLTEYVSQYSKPGNYFYLLNHGNAVNFVHGAVVGPFIYLVQSELITGIAVLAKGEFADLNQIGQVVDDRRREIAGLWLKHIWNMSVETAK